MQVLTLVTRFQIWERTTQGEVVRFRPVTWHTAVDHPQGEEVKTLRIEVVLAEYCMRFCIKQA